MKMKMMIRRSLCALATIVLAAGLGACGGDELVDALDRALADAGVDDTGRGGTVVSDAGGSDAGNPALDVGIGGEDTGGGGGTDDGLGCFDIVQCINNGDGSEASVNACIAQGSTTGTSLVNALVGCIQNNCGTAQTEDELAACQQQFCADEIAACQADTNGGGGGGGGGGPVGNTGAYESCNTEPCQAGMACGSFDGTNGYCFPECGVGGACVGWDGAPGICAVGLEGGGGTTPTHCLPTCADTEGSTDCPAGWTCEVQQGQGVCSP